MTINVNKQVLARLEKVYAVTSMRISGKTYYCAATEEHGKCLLFSPPHWKVSEIWHGPGGCMLLIPAPNHEKALIAIQGFFPIFQSKYAGVVYAESGEDITQPWQVTRVIDLPFVHRIATVQIGLSPFLIAASLCSGKDFRDDWSQPGAVYAGPIPQDLRKGWPLQPILESVSKNHGIHVTLIDKKPVVMVCGKEGLFMLQVPKEPSSQWQYEQLLNQEISDIYSYDLDGDGTPEIVTIEPFHGDRLVIYKRISRVWRPVFETTMDLGHVVWAGEIGGEPAVLGGSREGAKELFLLQPTAGDLGSMSKKTLDRGIAPTQVVVDNRQNHDFILSANNGADEVALYKLTR